MTNRFRQRACLLFLFLFSTIYTTAFYAQQQPDAPSSKSDFWKNVQFGGSLGLAFGSGYTDISVAPGAIYNFNEHFALGTGLQYSYIKQRGFYSSHLYGGSVIGLFNPIPQLQLSLEVEQLRANVRYETIGGSFSDDFWNTGLFVGAGYRTANVTVGVRYNLLFKEDRDVYSDAFMPFVRVYF